MMWIWMACLTVAVLFLGVAHGYEHGKGLKARMTPVGMVLVWVGTLGFGALEVFDSVSIIERILFGVVLAVLGFGAYILVVSRIRSAER